MTAVRAWLLSHLDGPLPVGKAQQPLSLQVGLLLPGRLFFHCFNLHTSPGGMESGSVSLVTAEAQSGDAGLQSEAVGCGCSLNSRRPCRLGDV